MRREIVKLIGIFFILLVVADLILFLIGKIGALSFWIVMIISGIVAYKVLPKLKK